MSVHPTVFVRVFEEFSTMFFVIGCLFVETNHCNLQLRNEFAYSCFIYFYSNKTNSFFKFG